MQVVSIASNKGGVGKTATAVNLGYVAAATGARTLVWDLDSQAAATFYFRVKPKVKGGSVSLIGKKKSLPRVIRGTDFDNLDVVPGDFTHRNLDLVLDNLKKPQGRLGKLLERVADDYDIVILDCPPGIGVLAESVFRASDAVVVPVIPTTLSLRTLDQLTQFTSEQYPTLPVFVFFSMVDRRKRLHRDVVAGVDGLGDRLFESTIPNSSVVEKMGVNRAPVGSFAPRSLASQSYRSLWSEVRAVLDDD